MLEVCFVLLNMSLSHSRSLKVIGTSTIRSIVYEFHIISENDNRVTGNVISTSEKQICLSRRRPFCLGSSVLVTIVVNK